MPRYLEIKDKGDVPESDAAELIFRKAMKRVEKHARRFAADHAPIKPDNTFDLEQGRDAARQELIIQLIEWFGVELDGEVNIILYED